MFVFPTPVVFGLELNYTQPKGLKPRAGNPGRKENTMEVTELARKAREGKLDSYELRRFCYNQQEELFQDEDRTKTDDQLAARRAAYNLLVRAAKSRGRAKDFQRTPEIYVEDETFSNFQEVRAEAVECLLEAEDCLDLADELLLGPAHRG